MSNEPTMTIFTDNTFVEIDGHRLPCLRRENGEHEWWAWVPLENGWVAYILAMPRSDETEFCVAPMTFAEAQEKMRTHGALPKGRKWEAWPRGEWDLYETLQEWAQWDSPILTEDPPDTRLPVRTYIVRRLEAP